MTLRNLETVVAIGLAISAVAFGEARAGDRPGCSQGYMEIAPAEVVAHCTAAISLAKNAKTKANLTYIRGRGYHRSGRLAQAIVDYDASLALNPANAEVHISRSWSGFSSGNSEIFFRHAEKAYHLAPQNARMWDVVGFAMMQSGEPYQALEAYGKALDLDPRQPFALLHRIQLFMAMKRPLDALNDANRLVDIPQKVIDRAGLLNNKSQVVSFHAAALLERADILRGLRRMSEAQKDYERAIAAERSEPMLMALARHIEMDASQTALLIQTAEAATILAPASLRAARMLALGYTAAKDHQQAAEAYARVIELAPKDGFAHYSRAIHLKSLQQYDGVAREMISAFNKDPRAAQQTISRMVLLGHWKGAPVPDVLTDPLADAFKLCANDPQCI